ncbi:MAG TPA: NFACT RNA binding domain-containing protein [Myxococcales bacterium]|nr:NFACT RNA binding domain-containing protein [Myxococcales bacterium]
MSLRQSEMLEVARELERALAGAAIHKAWSPLRAVAYLEVRHRVENEGWRSSTLCLCAEPEVARLSVVTERFPSPPAAPPFQRWLRQELAGGRISAVRVSAEDRVVRLEVETERGRRALVGELLPARGALVLLSAEDRVLAVSPATEAREGLEIGRAWAPPPGALSAGARALPSRLTGAADRAVAPPGEPGRAGEDAPSLALVAVTGATGAPGLTPPSPFPLAESAEALFADRERARRAEAIRRRLVQPLRARRDRLARTVEKVRAEASRAPEAERLRHLGELLSRNLHAVQRGQKEARLTDYGEDGAREVVVPLDPKRTPREQAERYFHQYRRLTRGSAAAAQRLAALEQELAGAERELRRLGELDGPALLERAEVLSVPEREGPPEARPFREYRGAGGARIWVGKTSEGNDALTFRAARPHDLWLHARGVPGAHVVVPLARAAELPQELLLDAAHLALHHSQLKGEPRGEVSYTPVKRVRKVKGGAPGQVTYTGEKTFVVRVEPDRLERLLKSVEES